MRREEREMSECVRRERREKRELRTVPERETGTGAAGGGWASLLVPPQRGSVVTVVRRPGEPAERWEDGTARANRSCQRRSPYTGLIWHQRHRTGQEGKSVRTSSTLTGRGTSVT